VLRELMEGKIPERMKVSGNLPFMLQKAEQLIWVFPDVTYYEDRTRRQYVGRSHGVSIRIARGFYYRAGHSVGTLWRLPRKQTWVKAFSE